MIPRVLHCQCTSGVIFICTRDAAREKEIIDTAIWTEMSLHFGRHALPRYGIILVYIKCQQGKRERKTEKEGGKEKKRKEGRAEEEREELYQFNWEDTRRITFLDSTK